MTPRAIRTSLVTRALLRRLAVLAQATQSARAWTLLSVVGARGAGFTLSFFLARFGGAEALGAYTTLLNTGAAVVTPYSAIVGNNATIMAAAANRVSPSSYSRVARASVALMVGLSVLSFVVFLLLGSLRNNGQGLGTAWAVLGGASVILGQACFAAVQGSLYGAGRFVWAAQVSAMVAVAVALCAGPLVWWAGLNGALALVLVLSLLPGAILGWELLSITPGNGDAAEVWRETWRRFVAGLANVAATTIDNGVNWVCGIYLVREAFGMEGVGVLGISMQWHTAMLLPVMGWSGVTLKALTDASEEGDASTTFAAVISLAKRNLWATAALAGVVALGSPYLAAAYGLGKTDLALLVCIFAVIALLRAVAGVLELLMFCLNRQRLWLLFSVPAFALQAVITFVWIGHGLWVVLIGILAATVARGAFCLVALPGLVRHRHHSLTTARMARDVS